MGKKKKEILDEEKIPFLEGAARQGYSAQRAGAIYDMLVPFAGYGFNKSHAAAYSVLAYQTAYLKANFPAEYMAATMIADIKNTDKLLYSIDETRKMGIPVDPPNVNYSDKLFTVVNNRIIYGFLGIKGVGEAQADEIVRGRKDGPYKSFLDFLDRVDIKAVSKKAIELLIQTGAFDSFGISRETLEGNFDKAVEYALKNKEDKLKGQSSLFEDAQDVEFAGFDFEEFSKKSRPDILNKEKQLIGFYFSGHPMDEYKDIWKRAVKVNIGQIESLKTGNCILVGIIKNLKTITTNKGSRITFASLEDFNGEIEVTFFAGSWEKCQNYIEDGKVVILKGKIDYQKDKDKYSFIAEDYLNVNDVDVSIKETEEYDQKAQAHKNTWAYMADLKSGSIKKAKKGSYTIIGYLKSLREFKDRNDNDMAFGTLQDFEGEIELVFFSKVFSECRSLLNLNEIIAVKGNIDPENERNPEKISFKVSSIADFDQLSRSAARKAAAGEKPVGSFVEKKPEEKQPEELHIRLKDAEAANEENLNLLRDYLAENSGSFSMLIHIPVSGSEKIIRSSTGINMTAYNILDNIKKYECVAEAWSK